MPTWPLGHAGRVPEAVIFDLDGVLLDSEQRWNEAKEALVREAGGTWAGDAARVMMGMSSPEWSAYLRDELGVPLDAEEINRELIDVFLDEAGVRDAFGATVSSEEVARGKPAPDVDLAGMAVIVVPDPHDPPEDDAPALAAVTVTSVGDVSPATMEGAAR